MQGTCPNPGCGAAYTLAAQNVGRQFACRQCGVMLKVEADGLHLAAEPIAAATPAAAAAPTAAAASRAAGAAKAFAKGPALSHLKENLCDWLFGAGAVLVIIFTFFPVLDKLRANRFHADIKATETEFQRSDRESTTPLNAEAKKNREKKLEALRDRAEDQDDSSKYAAWWYGWGTLLGFLLLAVACIAWMGPNQSRTHRVVAAVVICAQLLLVFIAYIVGAQRP
jgi:hypothetical protein